MHVIGFLVVVCLFVGPHSATSFAGQPLFTAWVNGLIADVLPIGHHGVHHQMVFVESETLANHRLIAGPTQGWFGGVKEIVAGEPISLNYYTRFYIAPPSIELPEEVDEKLMATWTSHRPPVRAIRSAPWYSPVVAARTTYKLLDVRENEMDIEVVDHVLLDANGHQARLGMRLLALFCVVAIGIAGCAWLLKRIEVRRSRKTENPAEHRQESK